MHADPPVRTDPPYVPLKSSAWPRRKLPRWTYLAAAGLVVVAVAVGLVHRPSAGERASDLRGYLQQVTADIESCAGGVGESLTALHQVQSGAASTPGDVSAGISVAQQGAANCSPANNELIDDLENYQAPESLYSFRLASAVTALVDWAAPDAERVQTDVASVLAAHGARRARPGPGQADRAIWPRWIASAPDQRDHRQGQDLAGGARPRPAAAGLRRGAMHYLTQHWSFDPFLIVAIVVVGWHEIGLAKLARRSRPDRTRQRRLRSLWFYAGLIVLLLAVQSPIDYWSDDYFFVHMIQHLLLMFGAPTLIVAGAPWQPLLDALPGRLGQDATREVLTGGWSRPLRAVAGWLLRPWVSVAAFNLVMLCWHVPAMFDLAERNSAVHIWLAHASFFARRRAVLAPVHRVAAVPPEDAADLAGRRLDRHERADVAGRDGDGDPHLGLLVPGLQPHPRRDAAALRGPADRRGHLVDLR